MRYPDPCEFAKRRLDRAMFDAQLLSELAQADLVGLSGFQWLSSRVGTFVQVPGWMLLPAWAAAHGVSYLLFRSWRRAADPRRCAMCGYLADRLPQCPECGTRRRVIKEVTGDDPSSAQ